MQVKTYTVSSQRTTVSLPPFARVFSNILSKTPRNYPQTTRPRVLPNSTSLVANQASTTRFYATPRASRPGSFSQRPSIAYAASPSFSSRKTNNSRIYLQTARPRVLSNSIDLFANQSSTTRFYSTPRASRPGSVSQRPSIELSPFGTAYAASSSLSSRKTFSDSSSPSSSPSQRRLCRAPGCGKCRRRGGFCFEHGGGKICTEVHCGKSVQSGNQCFAHGASNRCHIDKCKRMARDGGLCRTHHIQLNPKPY